MVTVRYFPHTIFQDTFWGHFLSVGYNTRTENQIRMISTEGYTVDFYGQNITYDKSGLPKGGVINRVEFLNQSGGNFVTVSKGDFAVADFFAGSPFVPSMYFTMIAEDTKHAGSIGGDKLSDDLGNDTAFGGGGNDFIDMGVGNDKMTGGAGRDEFYFDIGDGRDVITDFEATGTTEHDHIRVKAAFYDQMDIVRRGADVYLNFATGDVLILRDVAKADISSEDFIVI